MLGLLAHGQVRIDGPANLVGVDVILRKRPDGAGHFHSLPLAYCRYLSGLAIRPSMAEAATLAGEAR